MKTYLLGDHHTNHDDLLRAMLRKGWKNVRIVHVGDGEEGYPRSWDKETEVRLDNAHVVFTVSPAKVPFIKVSRG